MQRMLNVVSANATEDAKVLAVEYGGKRMDVHLEVLEPMRASGKWLVSDSDLRRLFGHDLKPLHASLIAALAGKIDPNDEQELPIRVDMDRLEAAMSSGSSLQAALAQELVQVDIMRSVPFGGLTATNDVQACRPALMSIPPVQVTEVADGIQVHLVEQRTGHTSGRGHCMTSIQFLLREPRSERQVLEALHRTLGLVIETIDSPVTDAVGLAQVSAHSGGFAQAWLVTWPGQTKAQRSFNECAPALASQFNVDVLVECGGAEDSWLLFSPDGHQVPVGVLETTDGIDVVQPPA